jgi:hypothetical protein
MYCIFLQWALGFLKSVIELHHDTHGRPWDNVLFRLQLKNAAGDPTIALDHGCDVLFHPIPNIDHGARCFCE